MMNSPASTTDVCHVILLLITTSLKDLMPNQKFLLMVVGIIKNAVRDINDFNIGLMLKDLSNRNNIFLNSTHFVR